MTGLTRKVGIGVLIALSVALVLDLATASGASASSPPPYEVIFDSTMVNQFAGQDNEPTGSETTEIQDTIPLAKSGSGGWTGSAEATYAQATGTITETCTANGTTGTTKEIEESGHPTTLMATYTPGAGNTGGSLVLDLGPFLGGLEESFQDIPGCGGFTVGNTTPRFLADFQANHNSQFTPSLATPGDARYTFALLPGASLGGPTSYAGTYDFTGGSSLNNLTYSETTSISVFAQNCVVPNVVGMTRSAAASALASAGCTVGTVTTAVSNLPSGTVLSSSPAAGTKLDPDSAVALVVSAGSGAMTCKVPAVKGDTLATARTQITHAGCAIGTVKYLKSSRKLRGHVLSQSPSAGSVVPKGTKVALTIGK